MRIFLTGATGFIGSRVIPELLAAGHQVLGMARSDAGARTLAAQGVEVHRAELEDPDSMRRGAEQADAVIHTAFDHDFSRFAANCEKDARVIEALGSALKGSSRPLLITSGTGMGSSKIPGEAARESVLNLDHPNPRSASEIAGNALLQAGVAVSVMRLPQVHDTERQGLITPLIAMIRANGFAGYIGEGDTRWPAAHVSDVAALYRLAIEHAVPGARYNAVAEEGIPAKALIDVIAEGLAVPVRSLTPAEASEYFGWLGGFMGLDMLSSSAWTRETLRWEPTGPGLLDDLRAMNYRADAS